MDPIDREYRARLNQLAGWQRVALAAGMFEELCEMVRVKIRSQEPGLAERELRKRVALALYQTDPETRRMIEGLDS